MNGVSLDFVPLSHLISYTSARHLLPFMDIKGYVSFPDVIIIDLCVDTRYAKVYLLQLFLGKGGSVWLSLCNLGACKSLTLVSFLGAWNFHRSFSCCLA